MSIGWLLILISAELKLSFAKIVVNCALSLITISFVFELTQRILLSYVR